MSSPENEVCAPVRGRSCKIPKSPIPGPFSLRQHRHIVTLPVQMVSIDQLLPVVRERSNRDKEVSQRRNAQKMFVLTTATMVDQWIAADVIDAGAAVGLAAANNRRTVCTFIAIRKTAEIPNSRSSGFHDISKAG